MTLTPAVDVEKGKPEERPDVGPSTKAIPVSSARKIAVVAGAFFLVTEVEAFAALILYNPAFSTPAASSALAPTTA